MPYKYTYDCPIKCVIQLLESKGFPDELIKIILAKTISKTKISGFIAPDGLYYKNMEEYLTDWMYTLSTSELIENVKKGKKCYKKHTDFALEALKD